MQEASIEEKEEVIYAPCEKCNKTIGWKISGKTGKWICPSCGFVNKKEYLESKKIEVSIEKKELEIAPYKNLDQLPDFIKKMTTKCQKTFMSTFNKIYKDSGDEGKSMSISINAAKRCMKKSGYKYNKESKSWIKEK
jgi:uncharacterized Zn finger protein (UPF0148 family)